MLIDIAECVFAQGEFCPLFWFQTTEAGNTSSSHGRGKPCL